MTKEPLDVVRACLRAYVDKDRDAIESLLDERYHFTSAIDNALDRTAYLEICWPNGTAITRFDEIYEAETGDRVFIVYEGHASTGKRFRNCELHTVRDGKLVDTEVYFGWDLPHQAARGTHVDDDAAASALLF